MERLWTKPFILMTIGNLFLFNAFYMLYPTLPLFIKQMGGNESQVGLAMGAVGGIVVLMGLRILHGMSWAVSTTATITAITDMIPSTRRGEGM
ncbi:MFS transporter, partial [Paenibacillus sp. S3N08]|nr:MFS transporter [Paenibacillus agricola]